MFKWVTRGLPKPDARTTNQIWSGAGLVLLLGLVAVILFPNLDQLMNNDKPGLLSIIGPAATISAMTVFYLFWLSGNVLSLTSKTVLLAVVYNALIIAVKFVIAPIAIFVNQTEFHFEGQFANIYNPSTVVWFLIPSIFLLYLIVFTVVRRIYSDKLKLPTTVAKKIRKFPSIGIILLIVAFCVFTGGFIIFLPLLFVFGSFDPLMQYLGFIFSGVSGLLIAACLISATSLLAVTFGDVAKQAVAKRSISTFVAFCWVALALLIVFHILWAVYFFVLVTLWPFKVTTVVPK